MCVKVWAECVEIPSKANNPDLNSIWLSLIYGFKANFHTCPNTRLSLPAAGLEIHHRSQTDVLATLDCEKKEKKKEFNFLSRSFERQCIVVGWVFLFYFRARCDDGTNRPWSACAVKKKKIFDCIHSVPLCAVIWGMYHAPVNQQHRTERL